MPIQFLMLALCSGTAPGAVPIQLLAKAGQVEVRAVLPEKLRRFVHAGPLTQDQGERWLRLAVVNGKEEGPAILAIYERRQDTLYLRPRYALVAGQTYRATLMLGANEIASAEYRVPPRAIGPAAVVEKIYPSGDELPANLLKFYLHFSKAMRESKTVFDHIHLRGPDGKEIADPWRRTELWSEDGKRLTLWIHPGRVKMGVNLREDLGPALEPGRRYTLVIDADLLDADGQALGKEFTKEFHTGPELRAKVRVQDWKVQPPRAGTSQPLTLQFPRPLDRALLERLITVVDDNGTVAASRIEVGVAEQTWAFHPKQPWRAADYSIQVGAQLEDLAGNTPARVFDLDLQKRETDELHVTLTFRPTGK